MTARWSGLIGVAGLLVSMYLSATHYFSGQVPLACATAGVINCEQVTTSPQSMIGPVPVAVLGFVWFAVWLVLLNGGSAPLRLGWAALGLVSVFYLVYIELFLIGAVCLWCTAAHVAVIALFLLAVAESTAPMTAQELVTDSPG
ncbi:MAG: vitamin K epoxide reductase family protein [Chloroflexi bacterium]|nr:vitamin K epoxide reductase family protein [Chloroflexota bacterium]